MPPVTVGTFSPSTTLSGGNQGLVWTQWSVSAATIGGGGFSDGQPVNVIYPAQSDNPTIQWTGTTANTGGGGTNCTVQLTEQLANDGPVKGLPRDTFVTISVTVANSAPKNVNIYVGLVPP